VAFGHSHFKSLPLAFVLIGLLVGAGCTATAVNGRLYIRTGPPPVVVERVPVAPGPGYVWVPGYYRWSGREYVWVGGRYEVPPHARARWVSGHWQHDRHGYYWVDGHWR